MACPNCDHTMQCVHAKDVTTWWCPRCGTIKELNREDGRKTVSTPSYRDPDRWNKHP